MSARDDFPLLAALAAATLREPEYERALEEIDQLRDRCLCGECGGPLVLRCDHCGTVHG